MSRAQEELRATPPVGGPCWLGGRGKDDER